MGRLCPPDKNIDLDVCDDCGYVENTEGDDRDTYSCEGDEAYCSVCLEKKGQIQCEECFAFVPRENVEIRYEGALCAECR